MVLLVGNKKGSEPNCWSFYCDGPPKVEALAQSCLPADFCNFKKHCILHEYTKAAIADSMRNVLFSWQDKSK
jgi:hypothetical protein